jgi:cardiolipin synthase A/B
VPVTGRLLVALILALPPALAACGLGPPPVPDGGGRPVALLIGPDDGPEPIIHLIASARASVWMEMYLLTDARAIAALADRVRAGCDVRVILEPTPYLNEDANQAAYAELTAAGAAVRWSTPRFSFTHAKTLIIDHARLVAMTLNLTGAGINGNREYAAVDDDPADVAAAEAVFAADETGDRAGAAGRVITSPDASRAALTGLIEQAVQSLAIEAEELTDPAIVAALLAARARGVAVTLVWPGPADAGAAFAKLAAAGATVRAVANPTIHAKVLVADGRTLYVGSANLTPTSLDRNRELGLRLDDADVARRVAATVANDAARGISP